MSVPPLSLGEKLALAILLWLVVTFFNIPLWDLAGGLFESYRAGSLPRAVVETILKPVGTILGLMFLFAIRAEDGIEAIVSHYWPAVLRRRRIHAR